MEVLGKGPQPLVYVDGLCLQTILEALDPKDLRSCACVNRGLNITATVRAGARERLNGSMLTRCAPVACAGRGVGRAARQARAARRAAGPVESEWLSDRPARLVDFGGGVHGDVAARGIFDDQAGERQ